MFRILKQYKLTLVAVIVIFILSTVNLPVFQEAPKFKNNDKVVHIILYFGLSFLLYLEYSNDFFSKDKYRYFYLIILFIPLLYGGLIEILQGLFFPPRTAEWGDWFADILGSVLGFGASFFIFKNRKND